MCEGGSGGLARQLTPVQPLRSVCHLTMISLPSPACLPASYTTVPTYPSLCPCFFVSFLSVLRLHHFPLSLTVFIPQCLPSSTTHVHHLVCIPLPPTPFCRPLSANHITLSTFLYTHFPRFRLPSYSMLFVGHCACRNLYFLFFSSRLYILESNTSVMNVECVCTCLLSHFRFGC